MKPFGFVWLAIAFAAGLGVWFTRGADTAAPASAPKAVESAATSVTPVADPTPPVTPADTISLAEAPPPPPPVSTEFIGSQQQPSAPVGVGAQDLGESTRVAGVRGRHTEDGLDQPHEPERGEVGVGR